MPATTACAHCGVVGLVRSERVVKGYHSLVRYYCGACDHTWDVVRDDDAKGRPKKSAALERPDRSRLLNR